MSLLTLPHIGAKDVATERPNRSAVVRAYRRTASRYAQLDRLERVPASLRSHAAVTLVSRSQPHPRRFLEIGVGTGLNLSYVHPYLFENDNYVGIDISPEMLAKARELCRQKRWTNIQLLKVDAAEYVSDEPLDGVLFSLSLCCMPDYETVLLRLWKQLRRGGVVVIFDAQLPQGWRWNIAKPLIRAFTVNVFASDMRISPWKPLEHLCSSSVQRSKWGYYVWSARKP